MKLLFVLLLSLASGLSFASTPSKCEQYAGEYTRINYPNQILKIQYDKIGDENVLRVTDFFLFPEFNSRLWIPDGEWHEFDLNASDYITYRISCDDEYNPNRLTLSATHNRRVFVGGVASTETISNVDFIVGFDSDESGLVFTGVGIDDTIELVYFYQKVQQSN